MNSQNFSILEIGKGVGKEVSDELKDTSFHSIKCDLFAGVQVALLGLPQALAYPLIAGLPISAGIFASVYSALMAIFFSSSRFLIGGPINTISIMLQTFLADMIYTHFYNATPDERQIAALILTVQICFFVGLFQILGSVLKLGKLSQFVSQPVVRGYMAGSMFAVMFGQLFTFTGMPKEYGGATLFLKARAFFTHMHHVHWPTLTIGLFSLSIYLFIKWVNTRLPAGLIALFSATSVLYLFNQATPYMHDVALIGQGVDFVSAIPSFEFPEFDMSIINQLVPISFAIALLGVVETTMTAKMMSTKTGQAVSMNREILSVGMGNMFAAFIGAMPIALSPIRSTLNLVAGAKTRLSGLFSTVSIALFVTTFAFVLNYMPLSALSAMILVTAAYLINLKETLVCLKATPQDRFVLVATFFSCIFFSLDVAFYIGVVLSITSYLRKAAEPQLQEYRVRDTGELLSMRSVPENEPKVIRVIKVEGELFFGATTVFESSLKSFAKDKLTKVIILQLKNARDIDASTCVTLLDLADSLKAGGCHLLIAGLTFPVWEVLSISGVVDSLGKENLFLFDDVSPHHYMKKAFQRAKALTSLPEEKEQAIEIIETALPEPV